MKIEARNITFGYNSFNKILENISFKIESSGCISIVGSSGCGKSTLLRILCGLLPSSKHQSFTGQVLIDNIDIMDDKDFWKQKRTEGALGFMFQEPGLLPNLEVDENIHLPLKIIGKSDNGEEIVSDYLKMTGLINDKDKLPDQLSGGMKTRTALARTFITRPKLLLLDEPFSDLDIVWKAKLYEEVKKFRNQLHSTIIIVTHDIFEAIYFSKEVMVLGSNHSIIEKVTIAEWSDLLDYNNVVIQHYKEFVYIKKLIENS
jgi:NitT/TauT family transport system ATP-binding protein